jgi:D-arabinose 1-dehydrogenase-like Zn-dependent alcohol dehydrogenase
MKALVYHGPGQKAWELVPDPAVETPTDAIVRISSSTICGTDLHILKGDGSATGWSCSPRRWPGSAPLPAAVLGGAGTG